MIWLAFKMWSGNISMTLEWSLLLTWWVQQTALQWPTLSRLVPGTQFSLPNCWLKFNSMTSMMQPTTSEQERFKGVLDLCCNGIMLVYCLWYYISHSNNPTCLLQETKQELLCSRLLLLGVAITEKAAALPQHWFTSTMKMSLIGYQQGATAFYISLSTQWSSSLWSV